MKFTKHYKNYVKTLDNPIMPCHILDLIDLYLPDFYETQSCIEMCHFSRKKKRKLTKPSKFSVMDIDGSVRYFKNEKHYIYGDFITPITGTATFKPSRSDEKFDPIYEVQSENIQPVISNPDDNVTESTTKFTTDPMTAETQLPVDFVGDYSDWGVNDVDQIASYLAKPQRYSTFAWAATNVLNDQLLTIANLFSVPSNIAPWVEKLKGFYSLKATLCFSFQINASPFTAGRIRAAYYPAGEDNARKASIHFTSMVPFLNYLVLRLNVLTHLPH